MNTILSNPIVFLGSAFIVGLFILSQIPRIERFRAKYLEPLTTKILLKMMTEEQLRELDKRLKL